MTLTAHTIAPPGTIGAMDIRGSEASSTDTEDYFGYQRQTLAEKTPVTEAIRYATRRIV